MTTFQFDENNSCTSFIRRCKKGGLASAKRFQRKHKNTGLKDPQMLAIYLALGGVLVTFDNHMIDDHEDDIPEQSPGIIIIEHSPAIPYTFTQKSAEKIIAKFKEKVPDWHQVPWENSIVRLSDATICIGRKQRGSVIYDYLETVEGADDAGIKAQLALNAIPK